jgi:hypothetical protein
MNSTKLRRPFAALAIALWCVIASASDFGAATDQSGQFLGVVVSQPMGSSQAIVVTSAGALGFHGDAVGIFRGGFDDGDALAGGGQPMLLELLISPEGITHPYAPYVYFDSAGCTGQAYVSAAASRLAADTPAAIVGSGADLYVVTSADPRHAEMKSVLNSTGCRPFVHVVNVEPAVWTANLGSRFVPPFHW